MKPPCECGCADAHWHRVNNDTLSIHLCDGCWARWLKGKNGIKFSGAARDNMAEVGILGIDIRHDVESLRRGERTKEELFRHCMNGADPDREQGWKDYVDAIAAEAAK